MTAFTPPVGGRGLAPPSDWLVRFSSLIPKGGRVLDVAAGKGRHTAWLLNAGFSVVAVDRDVVALGALDSSRLRIVQADLEEGKPWPLGTETFDAVVVVNYLWREIFDDIVSAVRSDGILLYETFADGNAVYGRPRRPEFLLRRGELATRVDGKLRVLAYEDGFCSQPSPRVVQRICATGFARSNENCALYTPQ